MASWFNALSKTRDKIAGFFASAPNEVDEDTVEDLEEVLMASDLAPSIVMGLVDGLEKRARKNKTGLRETLKSLLLDELGDNPSFEWPKQDELFAVLIVGINGSGKTTTVAKIGHLAKEAGLKPLLGAGDTFRAAGSEQLKLWAEKVGCAVVGGKLGGDSASVAFDAVSAAMARHSDVVLVDTAGRMHTKGPLMQELAKIRRSMGKACEGAPHETWIVLDATLGQNAVIQAKYFHDITPLTGVIISKLDGSSKGGFLFSVKKELNVPILFAGLGEQQEDLVPFDAEEYVDALLGIKSE
ncbi:signal recognition particle-docking protein FtsY [Verrucomicrobiota bacterium]